MQSKLSPPLQGNYILSHPKQAAIRFLVASISSEPFAVTTSDEIGQIISDIISETDQFYHVYGKALAAWGEIEYGLSLWFQVCTRLEYNMAQNLFFSGRSFSTRSDLLFAALETANLDEKWKKVVVEGANKAGLHSATRNRLAHGLMHPNRSTDDTMD